MNNSHSLFTIGHSNHSIEFFLELLKHFQIDCVVDVRSMAASSYSPQFTKEFLSTSLKKNNIRYAHFADEFGARHTNYDVLDEDGKVDFEKVRISKKFLEGVEKLEQLHSKHKNIALMCSEGNPLECHRFSMIAVYLQQHGWQVQHILKDKTLLSNDELEKQLLEKYQKKLPVADLFNPNISREDQLKEAYRLHNKDIAWQLTTEQQP
ncbi:MAG TPA: DUF488 domain-containing protein [Chitinophagales bacterium]|nr:DUF488 domain-containing protein [Chitinophagales bacterium]